MLFGKETKGMIAVNVVFSYMSSNMFIIFYLYETSLHEESFDIRH